MSPLPALGVKFDFQPGPVIAEPLRTQAAVDALPNVASEALAPEVMATLRTVRSELPKETTLLGFCGAPWTLAAYLVEGKGVNGFPTLRAFAHQAPAALDALLGKLADAMAQYLIAQRQAGADAVQIFDSWAGALSLPDWQRIVRPHLLRLLQTVGDAQVPRILFLQNAPHLLDAYAELPAEALAVDWRVDIAALQRKRPGRPVQGNLDPAVLLAGPEATRRETAELLRHTNPRGHIVNLGHGILPQTPLDSVAAFVETVHEDGVNVTDSTREECSAISHSASSSPSRVPVRRPSARPRLRDHRRYCERHGQGTMRPAARVTRSPQRCANPASWVTSTSVVPVSRLRSNSRSETLSPVAVSRLPVGSSAKSTLGPQAKARAMATRCCSPPESWRG